MTVYSNALARSLDRWHEAEQEALNSATPNEQQIRAEQMVKLNRWLDLSLAERRMKRELVRERRRYRLR